MWRLLRHIFSHQNKESVKSLAAYRCVIVSKSTNILGNVLGMTLLAAPQMCSLSLQANYSCGGNISSHNAL